MVYYCNIDLEKECYDIFNNGELVSGNNLMFLENINVSKKTTVYINHLKLVKAMLPGGVAIEHGGSVYQYKYGNTTFRSFDSMIANNAATCLKELYGDIPVCIQMCKYIEGLGNPKTLPLTLAAYSKKKFYADIKDELWEETKKNKHYTYDLDTYYDLCAANKGGLKKVVLDAEYSENIIMFDKKSAYPSAMIHDNIFPIGCIKRSTYNKSRVIKKCLQEKQWCKVVFDGFDERLGPLFYDEENDKTALEYWDLWTYFIINKNLDYVFEKIEKEGRLYSCQECGYLATVFRDRIMDLYEEKERQTGLQRFLTKTMLDMLYGKGLQKYTFRDKWEMQSHYRGRGENYMCPEFSNHCAARTRYELMKGYLATQSVYFDTDGLKCKDTEEARKYFESENEKIMKENKDAGYDTKIGTWECEGLAKKLLVFRTKMYAYQTEDEFVFKHAGMQKRDMNEFLNTIKGDKIEYMRFNGFDFVQRTHAYENQTLYYQKLKTHIKGDLQ